MSVNIDSSPNHNMGWFKCKLLIDPTNLFFFQTPKKVVEIKSNLKASLCFSKFGSLGPEISLNVGEKKKKKDFLYIQEYM